MNDEEKDIQILTEELTHKLETDLITGLGYCESVIKGNNKEYQNLQFHDYLDKIQEKVKRCSCYTSWSVVKTLAVKCRTCSQDVEKNDDTKGLLCLSCFLNGNHKGHDVQIVYSANGNCCCGDPNYLKSEGFCCKHSNPEKHPELTQLDKQTRISMINVSKSLLKNILFYSNFEPITFSLILKWLQRLIFIGDSTRRCVAIAWSQTINLFDLYRSCICLSRDQSDLLLLIIGSLMSDEVFCTYFSESILSNLDHFIWLNSRFTLLDLSKLKLNMLQSNDDLPLASAVQLFTFSYQVIPKNLVSSLIKDKKLDWVGISIKSLEMIYNFMFSSNEQLRRFGFLDISQKLVLLLIESGLKNESKDELVVSHILNFVDQFSAFCRKHEMSFSTSRVVFGDKLNDPTKLQTVVFEFFFNIYTIIQNISNEKIISDTPIYLLDDYLMNDLNSAKIDVGVPGSIFDHSVLQKSVNFSQVYPLHLLAFVCSDVTSPNFKSEFGQKIGQNDPDDFLKRWILMPIRYLAACDLNQFDFFTRNDAETINVINSLRYKNNITNNFTTFFSLIQTILLLHGSKEEILEIICSTYGLFLTSKEKQSNAEPDNNESELMEKQIHGRLFAFLHLICSLIFDDNCIKKDFDNMRRMAVITHLKFRMSGLTAIQIDEVWPNHPMNDIGFIKELKSFASEITGAANGNIYKLKSGIDWHPILPFLDTGLILQAIQDFCNKNTASLIPFPSLPNEIEIDKYRKEIFFQPLIFAFEFLILSEYSNFQELLQLTLNLIVLSKRSEKSRDNDGEKDLSEIRAKNLLDLVQKLKGVSFSQFLKTKIALEKSKDEKQNEEKSNSDNNKTDDNSNSKEETSQKEDEQPKMKTIIDLISELGDLGSFVLSELGIQKQSDDNNNNNNNNNKIEDKHESTNDDDSISSPPSSSSKSNKASLLKMQIMQNFKDQQKSFSEANEIKCETNSSKYECSVCRVSSPQDSADFDDYLFYPCLSYKTVIPNICVSQQIGKTVSLRICMHPIHRKCIDLEEFEEETNEVDDSESNSSKKLIHFQCPFDRSPRNCLLPIITNEFDPIPRQSPLKTLLSNFVSAAYGSKTFIVEIIRSYSSEIELLEIRSRDNASCLDSLATQTMLHLVYLALWHTRSSEADYILEHDDESITPLMKYILILISLGPRDEVSPHDIVHAISSDISQIKKIIILIRFLRCCAIFDYYGRNDKKMLEEKVQQFISSHSQQQQQQKLQQKKKKIKKKSVKGQHIGKCITTQNENQDNKKEKSGKKEEDEDDDENILKSSSSFFSTEEIGESIDDNNDESNVSIDWEIVLSPEFLFLYYGINISSEVSHIIKDNYSVLFPVFEFNLPNNFLDFMKEPYSIDLSSTKEGEFAICLFTKKLVTLPNSVKQRNANTPPPVSEFLKTVLRKTFSAFLVLTGQQASSVIICDLKTNKIIRIKGFYVDEFDEEDPGLKRGHILTISQSKKKETIDNILSGNWTNYRTW